METTSLLSDVELQYKPPACIRLFLHILIEVITEGTEKCIKISMVVENFRTLFYWLMLGVMGLGMFLTKTFSETTDIIKDVFGASNVCVYFDIAPSTYVLPFFWLFPMLFAITYDIISMFRIWVSYREEKISLASKNLLFFAHIYFMLTVMLFGTIFAVSPDRKDPTTMILHSVPYLNLKFGMCILQVAVVWFGTKVAWKDFKLSKFLVAFNWLHVGLQILTMVISSILAINAIGDMGTGNLKGKGIWWSVHNNPQLNTLADIFVNYLSFLLNMVVPLLQSQYFSYKGFKNISNTHAVVISIADNRKSGIE